MPDLSPLAGTAADPLIHARQSLGAPALFGKVEGMWTNQKIAVSCPGCVAEIERRLGERKARA